MLSTHQEQISRQHQLCDCVPLRGQLFLKRHFPVKKPTLAVLAMLLVLSVTSRAGKPSGSEYIGKWVATTEGIASECSCLLDFSKNGESIVVKNEDVDGHHCGACEKYEGIYTVTLEGNLNSVSMVVMSFDKAKNRIICSAGHGIEYLVTLQSMIDEAKQKQVSPGNLRSIATALQSFAFESKGFPIQSTLGPISAIENYISPDYINRLPHKDPWDGDYLYLSYGEKEIVSKAGQTIHLASNFLVISTGKDRRLDKETLELLKAGPDGRARIWSEALKATSCLESDIIWRNDGFIRLPKGKQEECGPQG